jgi:hypothetical protein
VAVKRGVRVRWNCNVLHEIASTSCLSCLWKFCELVSSIEEQLYIVFMYTGNLYRVRWNCNVFNLAMENVLKGLPDKIRDQLSRHHTQNNDICQMHFKCRPTHFWSLDYDWGIFFILVTLDLCLIDSPWFVKFSKMAILISMNRDLNFF